MYKQYEFVSLVSNGHPIYLPEYADQEKFSFSFCDWVNMIESDYWAYPVEDDSLAVTLFDGNSPSLCVKITSSRIFFLAPREIGSMTESEYSSLTESILMTLGFINMWIESFPLSACKEFLQEKEKITRDFVYSDEINDIIPLEKSLISENEKYDLRICDLNMI